MISVSSKEIENFILISLQGTIIYGETKDVNDELHRIPQHYDGYILELSNVKKIDSTGFGALVNFAKSMKNKRIIIVVKNELIYRLMHIAKLDLIFSIFETVDDAIKAFKSGEVPPIDYHKY